MGGDCLHIRVLLYKAKYHCWLENFVGRFHPSLRRHFQKPETKWITLPAKNFLNFLQKKLIFHKQYKGYFLAAVDASKILPPDTSEIRNVLGTCGNQFSERAGALVSLLYDPLSDHIINGILSNCNESERKNIQTENIAITWNKQHLTSYLLHGIWHFGCMFYLVYS